jgi:galactose mutarotase-like enzyme
MGPEGATSAKRGGLCLETQHFPDAPVSIRHGLAILSVLNA